jgi:hypothetical protein
MMKIDEKVETVGDLRQLVRMLGRLEVEDDAPLKNQRTGGALHLSIEVANDAPFDAAPADGDEG